MLRTMRRLYHPDALQYAASRITRPLVYEVDSPQYRVLRQALDKHVTKLGFKEEAVVRAARELGYNSAVVSSIGVSNPACLVGTPASVLELVKFHLVTQRKAIEEQATGAESLEEVFCRRLMGNSALGGHLRDVLGVLWTPSAFAAGHALPELLRLADDMVYFSTEKDHHDMAWYSKRAALSTAYAASEWYMARDKSAGFKRTLAFARTRLRDVERLGSAYNNVEEFVWYQLLMSVNLVKSQLSRG